MRRQDLQVPGSCSLLSLAPGFSLGFLNPGMGSTSLCLESFQSHHTVGRSSWELQKVPACSASWDPFPLQMQTAVRFSGVSAGVRWSRFEEDKQPSYVSLVPFVCCGLGPGINGSLSPFLL